MRCAHSSTRAHSRLKTRDTLNDSQSSVFDLIGEQGFARLIKAFYAQVPDDDVLGPMYPKGDLDRAEERLRDFLVYRFGGPPRYIVQRGHPRLRMRHVPFVIDQRARDRWIQLMERAFEEAELPQPALDVLRPFLSQTATFMINQ